MPLQEERCTVQVLNHKTFGVFRKFCDRHPKRVPAGHGRFRQRRLAAPRDSGIGCPVHPALVAGLSETATLDVG
jgi:hypothetical protein